MRDEENEDEFVVDIPKERKNGRGFERSKTVLEFKKPPLSARGQITELLSIKQQIPISPNKRRAPNVFFDSPNVINKIQSDNIYRNNYRHKSGLSSVLNLEAQLERFCSDKDNEEFPIKSAEKMKHQKLYSNIVQQASLSEKKQKIDDNIENNNLYFNVDDYTILSQLGKGTFGKIYLVQGKSKKVLCMKKLIISNQNNFDSLRNEYEIFTRYKHKNILDILGISEKKLDDTTFAFYILMEVAKTDWEKEINERELKKQYYTESELFSILNQLVNAMVYLQQNNVSHRDVKAQNVLVFPNNVYKLADFGEAKRFDQYSILSTLRGTELYMSPVLFTGLHDRIFDIKHNPYKSDVFSLGMCLLYAATLSIKVLCKLREVGDNTKMQIYIMSVLNKRYSIGLVDLMIRMLSFVEETRPDFIQLKELLDRRMK